MSAVVTSRFETVHSFRDPAGVVVQHQGQIFRFLTRDGYRILESFLATVTAGEYLRSGHLASTKMLSPDQVRELLQDPALRGIAEQNETTAICEHQRIWFPSFPHEWPAEMLHAAADLTLSLAGQCFADGFGIKDATPSNILFNGPTPVFVDLLSFEKRNPNDPIWLAQAQFQRMFLLPLAANRHLRLDPSELLLSRRDGIEPEEFYQWLGPLKRLNPSLMPIVTLPVWFRSKESGELYQQQSVDPERAQFILRMLLYRLRSQCRGLAPARNHPSRWSAYMSAGASYSPEQLAEKQSFVERALGEHRPQGLLDLGCNTGHYSFLAARQGARVVAVDSDPAVVGEVWRQAKRDGLNVLPLVVDLGRPTPALGWRNQECPSFLERAQGKFDFVLMLAFIHHLLITERVPLDEVLSLVAQITSNLALIEFVDPEDPMFRRLVRGRDSLYQHLTHELFEQRSACRFRILKRHPISGSHRWLYLLEKK